MKYLNLKMSFHSVLYFTIALLCLVLCSCESKPNPVYDLLVFRTELQNNSKGYTQTDWENAANRYLEISMQLETMNFTYEERQEIDKVKGEIAGYVATAAAQEVSDRIQNITNEIESFVDGFSKSFQLPLIKE